MKQHQIKLLRQQIERIDQKGFDLEAWKNYTIIILARIFGNDSLKIKQIEKLEYENNSWTLRDTAGKASFVQSCKKLGREILEASIDEIENLGAPERSEEKTDSLFVLMITEALENELKGSDYKEIINVLRSDINEEEKKRQIKQRLNDSGEDAAMTILLAILTRKEFII
jgi:hypothetical protein